MAISRVRQYELVAEAHQDNFGFVEYSGDHSGARVVFQGVEGAYGHQATLVTLVKMRTAIMLNL